MDDFVFPGIHGSLNLGEPDFWICDVCGARNYNVSPAIGCKLCGGKKVDGHRPNPQAPGEPGVVGSVHHPPFPFGWLRIGQPHPKP